MGSELLVVIFGVGGGVLSERDFDLACRAAIILTQGLDEEDVGPGGTAAAMLPGGSGGPAAPGGFYVP